MLPWHCIRGNRAESRAWKDFRNLTSKTLRVEIANRQRKCRIDMPWLRDAAERLFVCICENIKARPPAHLKGDLSDELLRRGRLSLAIVSNDTIRRLNRQFRDKDAPTDVLSFPFGLDAPAAELPFEIGEVVISAEKAAEQAATFGHSFEREIAFLF